MKGVDQRLIDAWVRHTTEIGVGFVAVWLGAIDDRFDQLAWLKYRPAPWRLSLALFEQPFVDIDFVIGLHVGPILGFDQLDDLAAERGGVLDLLPRDF